MWLHSTLRSTLLSSVVGFFATIALRKRVKFELGSKQIRMPPRKKHRCLRFAPDQLLGFVEKLSTSEIRSLVATSTTSRLRTLGPEVTIELVDSPASLVVEVQDSENVLCLLRSLESKVDRLTQDKLELKLEVAKLKSDMQAVMLISDEGYVVCVRAFADFVVHEFSRINNF